MLRAPGRKRPRLCGPRTRENMLRKRLGISDVLLRGPAGGKACGVLICEPQTHTHTRHISGRCGNRLAILQPLRKAEDSRDSRDVPFKAPAGGAARAHTARGERAPQIYGRKRRVPHPKRTGLSSLLLRADSVSSPVGPAGLAMDTSGTSLLLPDVKGTLSFSTKTLTGKTVFPHRRPTGAVRCRQRKAPRGGGSAPSSKVRRERTHFGAGQGGQETKRDVYRPAHETPSGIPGARASPPSCSCGRVRTAPGRAPQEQGHGRSAPGRDAPVSEA